MFLMKYRLSNILLSIFVIYFAFSGYKKKQVLMMICFVPLVFESNYYSKGLLINEYLHDLKNGLTDQEKLRSLRDWPDSKYCILGTEILCNSSIITYSPQSEIRLNLITGSATIQLTMDILMSEPFKFSGTMINKRIP